ncbi:molybdopterin molybdenumtransferase MoeA [Roseovarius spongiae]|uniref:Molybdopterin molybdenumtransferase n=1 Tax=Roseovarius spongiae TaxID=2320272 RepID=A0A3A8B9V1_9RHOB|nr:gephyrin-like molybdotransferase Glp [Roseovarius spongiae]RKF15093.1 molybdopterin molybdenumtransferase MoeA [Roseovarius spongiae]
MITVAQALDHLFALAPRMPQEDAPLVRAAGRTLARDVAARRDQPPFDASAMDGYAVRSEDVAQGARLTVIGEAAAGHRFAGAVGRGEAVRIFTGAPMPEGSDRVVIQEDVTRADARITLSAPEDAAPHVRAAGGDFRAGAAMSAPRRLRPEDIALLAAMNVARVPVARKPRVAIIATGDELVMPGEDPGPDQIIASNSFGLKALLDQHGAEARLLPIARDTVPALETAFDLARDADLVLTIGGASVGDHDLVGSVAESLGMERSFYKIAMRPGKPLMAGRMNDAMMIGLPGNPVSAMVCGYVFVLPVLRAMLGFAPEAAPRQSAPLAADIPANGAREHYMRATFDPDDALRAETRQDSALLAVLASADALLVRPPGDGPRKAGDMVDYLAL